MVSSMNTTHPPTWHHKHKMNRSFGQRLADGIANRMGSWPFIIIQTIIIIVWISANVYGYLAQWDAYPFVLLNLLFSTQAAYAAPVIMMSQNRAAERDREQALQDYHTNLEAKKDIEQLQRDIARIENEKLDEILKILQARR